MADKVGEESVRAVTATRLERIFMRMSYNGGDQPKARAKRSYLQVAQPLGSAPLVGGAPTPAPLCITGRDTACYEGPYQRVLRWAIERVGGLFDLALALPSGD